MYVLLDLGTGELRRDCRGELIVLSDLEFAFRCARFLIARGARVRVLRV